MQGRHLDAAPDSTLAAPFYLQQCLPFPITLTQTHTHTHTHTHTQAQDYSLGEHVALETQGTQRFGACGGMGWDFIYFAGCELLAGGKGPRAQLTAASRTPGTHTSLNKRQ